MTITQAIEAYLQHLEVTRSQWTVASYLTPLRHFETFMGGETPVENLTTQNLVGFARWVKPERQLAYNTFVLYVTVINNFYRFVLDEGYSTTYDELDYLRLQRRIRNIKGKRQGKRLPRPPEEWAVDALIKAAYDLPRDGRRGRADMKRWRDIALVETLRATGARPSEILGLTRGDLDLVNRSAMVGAKGGDQRRIIWDKRSWQALTIYITNQPDLPDDHPVFLRHHNAVNGSPPLSRESVGIIFRNLSHDAGLVKNITPKDLRVRFATGVQAAHRDLSVTQRAMGHKNPGTTLIYAQITDDVVVDAIREAQKRGLV